MITLTIDSIASAMKGDDFWVNPDSDAAQIVREAAVRGYIKRLSHTQAQWTEEGLKAARRDLETTIYDAPSALAYLIAHHKDRDLQMDRESSGGYTPALSVIANRIAGHFEDRLLQMIKGIHADAWMEYAPEYKGRTFHVGIRDNSDPVSYNATLDEIAARVAALGYKAKIVLPKTQAGYSALYVKLPEAIEEYAQEIYGAYLIEIGKAPTKGEEARS